MARPLGYIPPAPTYDAGRDELDDLVAALHESGLLRALAGAVRTYPELVKPLLEVVDGDTVQSMIALGGAVTHLDPHTSSKVAIGIRRARTAATEAARGRPEGPIRLFRRLRDPGTRRAIATALAALAAFGGALQEGDRSDPHPD